MLHVEVTIDKKRKKAPRRRSLRFSRRTEKEATTKVYRC
ncbi:hypothetical protein LA635_3006 [Erwinia amylovora LA635]|nr:hypothetical protein LA635_3006 [Erwinia amylovora LA635]CDK19997.1 hypothetical protein LA636_3005 [Erwinia amylovora LA636]CDK23368.1 hypothetical protein LA637_3008 [Erwinia amylovora LA637]